MTTASRQGRDAEPPAAPWDDGRRRRLFYGVLTLLLLCILIAPFFFNRVDHRAPRRSGWRSFLS